MDKLNTILNLFDSISLQEADKFSLKDRNDIKFIFNSKFLPEILNDAKTFYDVMIVENKRQSLYRTLYFDTIDLDFYKTHHNRKKNRYKIRYRTYLDTNDSFLEVKFKSNKNKTIKKRIKQEKINLIIEGEPENFIKNNTPYSGNQLKAQFYSTFLRTTLIHKRNLERVTIDLSLKYFTDSFKKEVKDLIIAEVKTEKFSNNSDFIKILKSKRIYNSPISKYCTGLTYYLPDIKQNRFKKRFIKIKKITNDS